MFVPLKAKDIPNLKRIPWDKDKAVKIVERTETGKLMCVQLYNTVNCLLEDVNSFKFDPIFHILYEIINQ